MHSVYYKRLLLLGDRILGFNPINPSSLFRINPNLYRSLYFTEQNNRGIHYHRVKPAYNEVVGALELIRYIYAGNRYKRYILIIGNI